MKIVCFGDSNTWGFDPRCPLCGRYEHIWTELLGEAIGWTVINQGENGRDIPKTPIEIDSDTDMLIVMLGTNDILQFWSPEATCVKMENFLTGLSMSRDNILLIAPPTMKFGHWVQDQELIEDSRKLAQCYKDLARRLKIRFLDAGQWNIPLAHDGVHLTEEAQILFADRLADYIKKEYER